MSARTVQSTGRSPTSKTVPPAPATVSPRDPDDDDDVDDGGKAAEEIGKTFTYRSTLTPEEAAALDSFKPRRVDDADDTEVFPLTSKQKNVTYVDIKQPDDTCQLGPGAEALCIAASHTGNVLAVGGRQGTVQLLNPTTLEPMDTLVMAELTNSGGDSNGTGASGASSSGRRLAFAPGNRGAGRGAGEGVVTSLAFRPDLPGSRMENVLLAAQGESVVHVHVGTKRVLHTTTEPGNKVNVLAMRADGTAFATAGSDYVVRVYDEATCSCSHTLDHGDGVTTNGHASNVFALAWHPSDPQVLLSGGWDNRVLVWDLRVHRSVRSISGPHICGDAIDIQPGPGGAGSSPGGSGPGGLVLTGSWRHSNALQLWDLGSGRLLTNLPWWQPEPNACLLYAARFGRGAAAGTIVAGGSGSKPMVRVYKMKSLGNVDLLHTVRLERPVHALAPLTQPEPSMAVCCDQEVHMVALPPA